MHIRAAIGSAVQQTNCHPFRHDRWLFMHNGYLNEFTTIKRDLVLAEHLTSLRAVPLRRSVGSLRGARLGGVQKCCKFDCTGFT